MSSTRVIGVGLVMGLVAVLIENAASRAADRPPGATLPADLPAPARVPVLDDRQLCALHATLYPDPYGELAASHPTQPQGQLEAAVLDELRARRAKRLDAYLAAPRTGTGRRPDRAARAS